MRTSTLVRSFGWVAGSALLALFWTACGTDELLAPADASASAGGQASSSGSGASGGSTTSGGSSSLGGSVAAGGSAGVVATGGAAGAPSDASVDASSDADAAVVAATVVPDFELTDENPASSTYKQLVSPRDYLGQVSAWYFGHST